MPSFRLPIISSEEMKSEILALDRHTCSGYGNIPITFLLECADELSHPLSLIFNMSVAQEKYPAALKFNNIVPIYKSEG